MEPARPPPEPRPAWAALVLLAVFVAAALLAAALLAAAAAPGAGRPAALGGAAPRGAPKGGFARGARLRPPARHDARLGAPHIVVDTLNLTHWLRGREPLTPAAIARTIDVATPVLRKAYADRIMFVLKDRESEIARDEDLELFRFAAERNRVFVYVAERFLPRPGEPPGAATHAALGRDDLFTCVLANRYQCGVLTNDRLRDFAELRRDVPPFHITEFAYFRREPQKEYIRPRALHPRFSKPPLVRPDRFFPAGAAASGEAEGPEGPPAPP